MLRSGRIRPLATGRSVLLAYTVNYVPRKLLEWTAPFNAPPVEPPRCAVDHPLWSKVVAGDLGSLACPNCHCGLDPGDRYVGPGRCRSTGTNPTADRPTGGAAARESGHASEGWSGARRLRRRGARRRVGLHLLKHDSLVLPVLVAIVGVHFWVLAQVLGVWRPSGVGYVA